jgi:hypothetical protein
MHDGITTETGYGSTERSAVNQRPRVRIVNITDPCDIDMNGMTGTLCLPFKGFYGIHQEKGVVGVRLDPCERHPEGRSAMVYKNEIEFIN